MTPAAPPVAVVVLISGRGSNMRALIESGRDADARHAVTQVFSDVPDAPGLRLAESLGVPARALDARKTPDRCAYDRELAAAVAACSPGLVALAGFMRILSPAFTQAFADRILNIHPSLLPKYPGLHTHRRALAAGDAVHGATVHYVDDRLDGGPAVIQASVAIAAADDETSLARRVQVAEHRIFPLAVRWHCEGRLQYREGSAWLDGERLYGPVQFSEHLAAG